MPDENLIGVPIVNSRAYWKGYLKLSLVSCPISLFPATSEREKIGFHQFHKQTGNRIKYKKVDAETGREVDPQRAAGSLCGSDRKQTILWPLRLL